MPERVVVQVDGRTMALSHLDKLLWPSQELHPGWTKGEALHYYAQVAPVMIPHLAGRPASFVRLPGGVTGQRFYSKNPPAGLPAWVSRASVPGRDGPKEHVVVDTLGDLMAMANLYAMEVHVPQWTTAAGPESHDRLVVDLDPGPGCDITDCCRVALLVRERLAADGLTAWAKTSGSKGLHLYALLAGATGAAASGYAKALARALEADHRDQVVSTMARAARTGRVFLDSSQNATTKTTAAPYTLRATDRPGVSAPLTWTEVQDGATGRQLAFTPDQVLARVADHGDLLAGLLDPAGAAPLP